MFTIGITFFKYKIKTYIKANKFLYKKKLMDFATHIFKAKPIFKYIVNVDSRVVHKIKCK